MNSQLKLKSTAGEGSCFYFDIILDTDKQISGNQMIDSKNKFIENITLIENNSNLQNSKILLVEDNKINMLLLKTIIRNSVPKATIFEASNGFEAVQQFESILPDIIFMDIQMPVMNGYEATEAIRKLTAGKNVPIIAITAGTEKDEKNKCLEIEMNDYISKPIVKGVIEKTLVKWVK